MGIISRLPNFVKKNKEPTNKLRTMRLLPTTCIMILLIVSLANESQQWSLQWPQMAQKPAQEPRTSEVCTEIKDCERINKEKDCQFLGHVTCRVTCGLCGDKPIGATIDLDK